MKVKFPKWPILLLCLVLVFPIFGQASDGGSIMFTALTYQIELPHAMMSEDTYLIGISIRILGFEVYERTRIVPTEELPW